MREKTNEAYGKIANNKYMNLLTPVVLVTTM